MRRRSFLVVPLPMRAILAALLGVSFLATTTCPARSSGIGRIAYSSFQGSSSPQIWLANPDGTNALRLTWHTAGGDGAAISPEGNRIVFESSRRLYAQLYLVNTDGTGEHRVLGSDFYGQSGSWSPDGTRIAFSHSSNNGQPGGTGSTWVVNANGTGLAQLSPAGVDDWLPCWSPDGTRIAFQSTVGGHSEILLMNADGSGRQQITDGTASCMGPRWSPDGTKLAYVLLPTPGSYTASSVHVMDAGGTNDRAVTDSTGLYGHACWSPDGGEIAFHSNRSGNFRVYRIGADGTNLRQVTAGAAAPGDWAGDWRVVTLPADVTPPATDPDLRWSVTSPARGTAFLRFSLPRDGETTVCLFDTAGRRVRTLLHGRLPAGAHSVTWNGRDDGGRACPAGVYLAELAGGNERRTAKLVLMR